MWLPSLVCVASFGWLTPRESRALLWPPRAGFTVPRGALVVPKVPEMRPRMCWRSPRRWQAA